MPEMPNSLFDNSETLNDCFIKLSKVNSVTRNCKKPIRVTEEYVDIWLVTTEVEIFNKAIDISYFLCFKDTFPHSLPRVVLNQYDLSFKYIPHLEENNSMCLFEDNITFSTENPYRIIQVCIDKANKTFKDGYEEVNKHHFLEEIKAYWSNKYDNEPTPLLGFIHSFITYPTETCIVDIIKQTRDIWGAYQYIVYNSEEQDIPNLFNLHKKNNFIVQQGLFIPDLIIPETPPYFITNNMLINMLSADNLFALKKYINNKDQTEKYIFFRLNKEGLIGGIKYSHINTTIKGFRPNKLSPFQILKNQLKEAKTTRLLSEEYSNNKIEIRTSGKISKKWKFLITGLGSVGSNLTYFLNSINYPEFTFVDNDILSIDNIGRHLLGYADVGKAKANAMIEYIKQIRPDQNTFGAKAIFEEYIKSHIDTVNNNDYLFVAIGNKQAEDYLIKMVLNKTIHIPVFILWVEPYLASGQCLYLRPQDIRKYHDHFSNSLYNHHVIHNEEYLIFNNPKLEKREAGCQTSFSPYSSNDLVLFLSTLYPHINNVVNGVQQNSFRFSWIGNLHNIKELQLAISNHYNLNDSFTSKLIEL